MWYLRRQPLLIAVMLCAAAPVARAQHADSAHTAAIAGLVRDSTGAPIGDAEVVLGALQRGARTDAQGWFTLEGVPPGEYQIHVQRLGYAWVEFRWAARAGERTEVAVTMPVAPRVFDSVVVEGRAPRSSAGGAQLSGLVVDTTGVQLPGVQVQVIGSGLTMTTADNGRFLFAGLAQGTYLLRARRIGFAPVTVSVWVGAGARNAIAVRMKSLGVMLDTVKVLAASGFGKNESAWKDFDARIRWSHASTRSVTLMGADLAKLGKLPLDLALRYTGAVALGVLPGMETPSVTGITTKIPAAINADPNSSGGGDEVPDMNGGHKASRVMTGTGPSSDIQDTTSVCILLNGSEPLREPLRMFNASDLQAVEVYAPVTPMSDAAPESDVTRSIEARMRSIPTCTPGIEGGHPAYFVVWLKGAS